MGFVRDLVVINFIHLRYKFYIYIPNLSRSQIDPGSLRESVHTRLDRSQTRLDRSQLV